MDTSPISGFITRKQAADRCKRSERTLQRYWSQAIELADADVLQHLKLRTEDGQVIEGPAVTKEGIDELKKSRKNPTWYVHASWVQKTYGPRLDESAPAATENIPTSGAPSSPPAGTHAALLEQRVRDLERDKEELRDELAIKNEQINQANERGREMHVLMRDLHGLLGDLQKRLPAPAPSATALTVTPGRTTEQAHESSAQATGVGDASSASAEEVGSPQPTEAAPSPPSRPRPKNTPTSRGPSKAKTAAKNPPSVFEKHTPTFHRAFTYLFRRR